MTIHFGVLIPSTNTTTETEYSRLPASYQAHYARVRTSTPGRPFSPGRDEEVEYQSQLLATAKVRMITLLQTSASLFADDYDARLPWVGPCVRWACAALRSFRRIRPR
jgi:maleate cis-trans isomerase